MINKNIHAFFSRKKMNQSFILLLIGGSIVGIGPILAKVIHADPISIVLYRIMLPIPFLLIFRFFSHAKLIHKKQIDFNKDLLLMIGVGFFFSLDLITFYISLRFTSVASATILANLSPVFLLTYFLLTKRTLSKEIIWPILTVFGLALLCGIKQTSINHTYIGDAMALLSAMFFTGYILLINKLGSKYSSLDIMLWSSIGGTLFLIFICLTLKISFHINSERDLIFLLIMSLGTQLIGQTILTKVISTFPPSLSSLCILIDPVSAACFSWILLGEALTMLKIIGAVLILISIVCAYKYNDNTCHIKENVNA